MIRIFCSKRGSGKTKNLINLANEKASSNKGDIIYIDDDSRPLFDLNRSIRFVTTCDYDLKDYDDFYGFLCGILSENYDIDTIFIDGLSNIVQKDINNAAHLFLKVEKLIEKNHIDVYININNEEESIPEFLKKYVA